MSWGGAIWDDTKFIIFHYDLPWISGFSGYPWPLAWISGSLGFVAQGCIFGEMKVTGLMDWRGPVIGTKEPVLATHISFIWNHLPLEDTGHFDAYFSDGLVKNHQLDNVLLVDFTLQCSCCSIFSKREVPAGARHHTWFYVWLRHLGPEQPCRGWKK